MNVRCTSPWKTSGKGIRFWSCYLQYGGWKCRVLVSSAMIMTILIHPAPTVRRICLLENLCDMPWQTGAPYNGCSPHLKSPGCSRSKSRKWPVRLEIPVLYSMALQALITLLALTWSKLMETQCLEFRYLGMITHHFFWFTASQPFIWLRY